MLFEIKQGDRDHDHWFLWVTADTQADAWGANHAIDELTKDLGRFCQVQRYTSCVIGCLDHWIGNSCPGTYGWEMWSLRNNNPQGRETLENLLPSIQAEARRLAEQW